VLPDIASNGQWRRFVSLGFGRKEADDLIEEKVDLSVLFKEWNEEDHPREQGGSDAGQFAPAGGGMSSMSSASKEQVVRAAKLRIPPAWTDVRISVDPKAPLQATGVDAKGRTQPIYSAEHSEKSAAEKFTRLKAFFKEAPKVEAAALKDMKAGDHTAAATYLIARTGFRPGGEGETLGDKQAYGATTLLGRHVKVRGDEVSFKFDAKKGVLTEKTLTDKPLADFMRANVGGRNEKVFDTSANKVRDYVKSKSSDDFSTKDFRTWHGTAKALELISKEMRSPPHNAAEHKKAFSRVKTGVAKHLGNTPAVAYSSYIDPGVWGKLETRHGR